MRDCRDTLPGLDDLRSCSLTRRQLSLNEDAVCSVLVAEALDLLPDLM